ncbi:BMC domain-containing protein [Bianquea renquensis]|uniref:BMC domain-containing protein n=1 Tax=Bianquea renquensis TaxID=2763661 RepID=A0A926DSP6_9FIRM|nr:BMC domain-containing protein [Bianquea renquensis]
MLRALGMLELKSIAKGFSAADTMVKTAEVELVIAKPICPGKFIVLIQGGIAAVTASLERGRREYGDFLVDSFLLGNPHDHVFSALKGEYRFQEVEAMGVVETWSVPSALVAADQGAKAAQSDVVKVGLARELGGKAYVLFTGEVAAVQASVEAAVKDSRVKEKLIDTSLIPNPDQKLWESILG